MAELKTKANKKSVDKFLATFPEKTQQECRQLITMMTNITKAPAVMWGDAIIGFGTFHYVYESGREGDWFEMGFAPRKGKLSIYATPCGVASWEPYEALFAKLGPSKRGKACIYITSLEKVDLAILEKILQKSYTAIQS